MKRYLAIATLITTCSCAQAQMPVMLGEQAEQVYPLVPDLVDSLADIAPVARLAGGSRVVCMGEATHGTHEFFTLKAKVFKQLVLEHGFLTFILEASFAECALINEDLNDPQSSAEKAANRLVFWTWHTTEVRDLIAWIRTYNLPRPAAERIHFMGCDMQDAQADVYFIERQLTRIIPDSLAEWSTLIAPLKVRPKDQPPLDRQRALVKEISAWLRGHDAVLAEHMDADQRWTMDMCLRNLWQATRSPKDPGYRDSCMAANIQAIDSLREGGLFVWAHNGHVMRSRGGRWEDHGHRMGGWLDKAYGKDLFVVGFAFHEGCFIARNAEAVQPGKGDKLRAASKCCVMRAPRGSLTTPLSKTGLKAFFVDMRGTSNELFLKEREMWEVGAVFGGEEHHLRRQRAAQNFDALIFVNTSTPAVPF